MAPFNKQKTRPYADSTPRLHRFPPLRKAPQHEQETLPTGLEYQQRLNDGFQQGVSQGFAKGLEDGRQSGFAQGRHDGFAEGMATGRVDAQRVGKAAFNEAAEPLSQLVEKMNQAQESYEERRRKELLQLVEKVTRQVIRCELALQPTQLLALIDEALTGMDVRPTMLKIKLNPEEYQRITDIDAEKSALWGLTPEPAMLPGECRIITDNAELDVGCEHRLAQCISGLRTSLLPEKADE